MRIPVLGSNTASSSSASTGVLEDIDIVVYGDLPRSKVSKGNAWTTELICDDTGIGGSKGQRLLVTLPDRRQDGAEGSLLHETEPFQNQVVIVVPRRLSRKARSRGWERLSVQQERNKGLIARAWLLTTKIPERANSKFTIVIYAQPDSANFMAAIPDDTPWQDLSILGTHDSCAIYGFPYAQCQQPATTITEQLEDGVRFLDLRMRVEGGELIMYHGVRSQRARFTSVLSEIHAFLSLHPFETLLVSLKEEVPPLHPLFSQLVWSAFSPYIDKFWFLESRLPTLGEIRGKGMIMPRFDIHVDLEAGMWDRGIGLKLESWPDDRPEGFELGCGEDGDRIRVQDWYGVPSVLRIPEKLAAVKRHLEPTLATIPIAKATLFTSSQSRSTRSLITIPRKPDTLNAPSPSTLDSRHPLTISYLSAASIPWAPPSAIAKGLGWPEYGLGVEGLNSRFTRCLLELMAEGKRVRGVVPVDFYRQAGEVGELLVVMNQCYWTDHNGDGENAENREEGPAMGEYDD